MPLNITKIHEWNQRELVVLKLINYRENGNCETIRVDSWKGLNDPVVPTVDWDLSSGGFSKGV